METIRISKNKHIQLCLSLFIAGCLIISTVIVFLLCLSADDWQFNTKYIVIFVSAFVGSVSLPLFVFFILRIFNKSYYLVTRNSIKLFKNGREIFFVPATSIKNLSYTRFAFIFLMQSSAGYMKIPYTEASGEIKPATTYSGEVQMLGIDMSAKQAKSVAFILGRALYYDRAEI